MISALWLWVKPLERRSVLSAGLFGFQRAQAFLSEVRSAIHKLRLHPWDR